MITVDASVVIALLDRDDSHHARARTLFESNAAGGFLIHPITLAEVLVGAVRNRRGTQRLAELAAIGITATEPDPHEPLLLAVLRVDTGLPMPDCCVLAAAMRAGAPVATFDGRLAGAAVAEGVGVVG